MKTLTIATLLLSPVSAIAGTPLQPIGKWTVSYAENMCALSHDFGEAGHPTSVAIAPLPLGEQTDILIIGPEVGKNARGGSATLTFDPAGKAIISGFTPVRLSEKTRNGARLRIETDGAPLLEDTTKMTVALPGSAIALSLPPMQSPLAALRTCQDDLLKGWGVDPRERAMKMDRKAVDLTVIAHLIRSGESTKKPQANVASNNPAQWVTEDDYPVEALAGEKQGTVLMLWTIGIAGRVTDCRVLGSSGDPSLDRASCRAIAARARYEPPKDKEGKPGIAHATGRVAWRMPN